jgi:hypothetical protein
MTDYSLMAYLLAAGALTLVGGVVLAIRLAMRSPRADR